MPASPFCNCSQWKGDLIMSAPVAHPYPAFFKTAIILVLTLGASWGAMLLWQIGTRGSFTGVSVFEVNAHGHAQILGWVGLFIMGVSLKILPGLWGGPLAGRRLAGFILGLTGIS